jgi:hypothetical protein
MAEVLKRTIRVVIDVEVTMQDIDAEVTRQVAAQFTNGDDMLSDPATQEIVGREQRLLNAIIATPQALRVAVHDAVVGELENLASSLVGDELEPYPDDVLLDTVREAIPVDDYDAWTHIIAENVFGENTEFLRAATSASVLDMTLTDVTEPLPAGQQPIDLS